MTIPLVDARCPACKGRMRLNPARLAGPSPCPVCNESVEFRVIGPAPAPGVKLGEYVLVERIGAGGFGEVWRACRVGDGSRPPETVALKIARDGPGVARLFCEAEARSRLAHRAIVRVVEERLDDAPPHLVIEHAAGSLRDRLRDVGPLELREAVAALKQVAGALAHAHERGVLHLDLKPENVLIRADGSIALADFGCARLEDADRLRLSTDLKTREAVAGTIGYAAPECLDAGVRPDARADVYGFGLLLFEVLTGRLPAGLERPGEIARGTPAVLDRVFELCYAADRDRRAAAMTDVIPLLAAATPGSASDPAARARRPRRLVRAAAAVLLLAGLGVGGWTGIEALRKSAPLATVRDPVAEGDRLAAAGDLEGARRVLRETIVSDPERADAARSRLRLLLTAERRLAEAERLLAAAAYARAALEARAVLEAVPLPRAREVERLATVLGLVQEARDHEEAGRRPEARDAFARAHALEPSAALAAKIERCEAAIVSPLETGAVAAAPIPAATVAAIIADAGSREAPPAASPAPAAAPAECPASEGAGRDGGSSRGAIRPPRSPKEPEAESPSPSVSPAAPAETVDGRAEAEAKVRAREEAAARREAILARAIEAVDAGRLEEARLLLVPLEWGTDVRAMSLLMRIDGVETAKLRASDRADADAAKAAAPPAEARPCTTCSGRGKARGPCAKCKGTESVSCNICKGAGGWPCKPCGAEGELTKRCERCRSLGSHACSTCRGAGLMNCQTCGGRRVMTISQNGVPVDLPCQVCATKGTQVCRACSGARTLVCPRCAGRGSYDVACASCSGKRGSRCHTCSGSGRRSCAECTDGTRFGRCAACSGTGLTGGARPAPK